MNMLVFIINGNLLINRMLALEFRNLFRDNQMAHVS